MIIVRHPLYGLFAGPEGQLTSGEQRFGSADHMINGDSIHGCGNNGGRASPGWSVGCCICWPKQPDRSASRPPPPSASGPNRCQGTVPPAAKSATTSGSDKAPDLIKRVGQRG